MKSFHGSNRYRTPPEKKSVSKDGWDHKSYRIQAEDERVRASIMGDLKLGFNVITRVWDNGGHPFHISIRRGEGGKVDADILCVEEFEKKRRRFGKMYRMRGADSVWYGCGSYAGPEKNYKEYMGNTMLIVRGRTCVSVASEVRQFTLRKDEEVTRYVSIVKNAGVPYGYIETTHGIYVLDSFNCSNGFIPWDKVRLNETNLMCNRGPDLVPINTLKTIM